MSLSLFNHSRFAHYRTSAGVSSTSRHFFGGDPASFGLRFVNVDPPFHLIYYLDLNDPAIEMDLEGLDYLPLVYGFHYATYDGEFTYRVLNAMEIEIVFPDELDYNPDFPYEGHPKSFPRAPVAFHRVPYDRTVAEDALSLQAIFGLDGLSPSELERAIRIGLSDSTYVCYSRDDLPDPNWTDETILRCLGRAPFMHGAPLGDCKNPDCTAEIAYHYEEEEIELPPEMAKLVGQKTMIFGGYDVRVDTMRVIAIHEPEADDSLIWGDPFYQMVFRICDCCQCIHVSHQCT